MFPISVYLLVSFKNAVFVTLYFLQKFAICHVKMPESY